MPLLFLPPAESVANPQLPSYQLKERFGEPRRGEVLRIPEMDDVYLDPTIPWNDADLVKIQSI